MFTNHAPLWGLAAYFGAVLVVVGVMLVLSWVLGERHRGAAKDQPYELGVIPVGDARGRFPVKFYLVAVMFVIFDIEAAFLFAWAIAFRRAGLVGYVEATIFVAVLGVGLAYLWRVGALDWAPELPRARPGPATRHAGRAP